MYDKFSFPLSFVYALLAGVSFKIIIENLKDTNKKRLLISLFALAVFVQAKPFLLSEFEKLPIWTTQNTYWNSRGLNSDYLEMIKFIKKHPDDGKYLSLPLTTGNAAVIPENESANRIYNGVSPLLTLSGKNDLSGLLLSNLWIYV